jgi:hypothetical protein
MLRRHDVSDVRHWGLITALACVVALCSITSPSAAEPLPKKNNDEAAQQDVADPTPAARQAALMVGGVGAPRTGSLLFFGAYFGGEHPGWKAWDLEPPLKNSYRRTALGTTTLVLNGTSASLSSALTQAASLILAAYADCWTLRDTDEFSPLPKNLLAAIKDGELGGPGTPEASAYAVTLILANYTSDKAFKGAVRTDLTHVHLFESPATSRGAVVRVTGHLLRINRYDPPWEADRAGVRDLYEAWIFSETFASQPYCVIFTEWPAELPRSLLGQKKIANPPKVTADGYFFKKYTYAADGPTRQREAPLLIGHTIRYVGVPPGDRTWGDMLAFIVVVLLSVVAFVIATVVGLSWWYRRNDAKLRKRLLAARSPEFIMPPPDAVTAAPVAVPVHGRDAPPPRFHFPPGLGERGSGESGPPGKGGDRGSTDDPPEDAGA